MRNGGSDSLASTCSALWSVHAHRFGSWRGGKRSRSATRGSGAVLCGREPWEKEGSSAPGRRPVAPSATTAPVIGLAA